MSPTGERSATRVRELACWERVRELEAGLLGCRQARSELEAELATERQAGQIELGQRIAWRIRAEKAETDARESLRLVRFLEARVAELERMEEHWHNKALLLQRGERLGDETPS